MPHTTANPDAQLADHLPNLRAMLENQRRFRLEQLAELDAAPADLTDAARREVTLKVAAAARQALVDIEVALELVATGDYGRCRECHGDIPLNLLRVIPTSRWCLSCRRRRTAVELRKAGSKPLRGQRVRAASPMPHGRHRHAMPSGADIKPCLTE